jgi:hypothetical protein
VFCCGEPTGWDVVGAQARKPIMMTRIYGSDGLSHAEEIEIRPTTA